MNNNQCIVCEKQHNYDSSEPYCSQECYDADHPEEMLAKMREVSNDQAQAEGEAEITRRENLDEVSE